VTFEGVAGLVSPATPSAWSDAVLPQRLIAAVIVTAMLPVPSGIVLSVIGAATYPAG
jgi:hypothetical protein